MAVILANNSAALSKSLTVTATQLWVFTYHCMFAQSLIDMTAVKCLPTFALVLPCWRSDKRKQSNPFDLFFFNSRQNQMLTAVLTLVISPNF